MEHKTVNHSTSLSHKDIAVPAHGTKAQRRSRTIAVTAHGTKAQRRSRTIAVTAHGTKAQRRSRTIQNNSYTHSEFRCKMKVRGQLHATAAFPLEK